jgi:hypothetical protein
MEPDMNEICVDHLSGEPGTPSQLPAKHSAPSAPNAVARPPMELPSHEVLSRLASEDPQEFERLRRELVESFIDSAPSRLRHRLSGIQFRVDGVRRLSRSALGSTVEIYQLMWQSFLRLNGVWQDVVHLRDATMGVCPPTFASGATAPVSARILEFRPQSGRMR